MCIQVWETITQEWIKLLPLIIMNLNQPEAVEIIRATVTLFQILLEIPEVYGTNKV